MEAKDNEMDQSDRLDILVRRFAEDSRRYRDIDAGSTDEEKRITLRSLMNIRGPRAMDAQTLALQDDYLRERAREKGVVNAAALPTIREALGSTRMCADTVCLWQGDITRLAAGAIVNAANSAMLGCFQPMHNCIDNCIHTFAGVELRLECERQMALLRAQSTAAATSSRRRCRCSRRATTFPRNTSSTLWDPSCAAE